MKLYNQAYTAFLIAFLSGESSHALTTPAQSISFVGQNQAAFSSPSLFASTSNDDVSSDMEVTAREARVIAPLSAITAALSLYPNGASAYEAADRAAERAANRAKIRAARDAALKNPPPPPTPSVPLSATDTVFDIATKRYFPGALKSSEVTSRVTNTLRQRGFKPSNTLMGSSLCSDEINYKPNALVNQMQKQTTNSDLGGVFNLGGLGGIPFVGTTGFSAFVSHCPVNGKIVFLYGPHVGVAEDGTVGKVKRIGVDKVSTSCGAAVGALRALEAQFAAPKDVMEKQGKSFDFQQDFIVENLREKLGDLAALESEGGDSTIAFTTSRVYSIIKEVVLSEFRKKTSDPAFWEKVTEVAIVGGVVINRDPNVGEDYFQPITFKGFEKDKEFDMYDEAFGDFSVPNGLAIRMREANMKIN